MTYRAHTNHRERGGPRVQRERERVTGARKEGTLRAGQSPNHQEVATLPLSVPTNRPPRYRKRTVTEWKDRHIFTTVECPFLITDMVRQKVDLKTPSDMAGVYGVLTEADHILNIK